MDITKLNIPTAKIKQLAERGINTLEDLLKFYPKQYLDFREESDVCYDNIGKDICVVGQVISVKKIGNGGKVIKCTLETKKNMKLDVLWFNQDYLYNRISNLVGCTVTVCGKLTRDTKKYFSFSIINPITFTLALCGGREIVPVYKKIPGMSDDYLKGIIKQALTMVSANETLSDELRAEFNLCHYGELFNKIHSPKNQEDINASKRRLIFDDMFYFAKNLVKEANKKNSTPYVLKTALTVKDVINNLPYRLTQDQLNTVREIYKECSSGNRLNALVQGDVGSGKTIVAFLSMLMFAENGYQSVLLAPTQVLAIQHYESLAELVKPLGYEVILLKSKMKAKEKREALEKIANGSAKLIIGTHSVFAEGVQYNNLALTITDEEHKFGVVQRASISEKSDQGVHTITMSATPIPRTLAMTLYGVNKKVFTISQMPSGRLPIKTKIMSNSDEIYNFLEKVIDIGQQCYVVCPFITKSEKEEFGDVESVEDVYKDIVNFFSIIRPDISCSVITGKMKNDEVEATINEFVEGKTKILIATTIIEVGVNVPNANVIVIKNAERFGLAQLHQLRGRVGRGKKQGYCILQSQDICNNRLQVMCETANGFTIAEEDLKYRGTGDLIGTVQSGNNKYIDLIVSYPKFFQKVKNKVLELYEEGKLDN